MKKTIKGVLIVIISFALIYSIFVGIDAIRLKNKTEFTPPFFSNCTAWVEEDVAEIKTCNGLGYTVKYSYNNNGNLNGSEFRLFNKILIWAWIS
ncbi:MAG TPA: hypothetical protein GXZ95_01250 [Mollicutes bacterium]|nr:hypothetical protein [Mollicutes bacterium]